jgi:hypothetical protein
VPHVKNGLLRPNLGIGLLGDRKNSFRLYAMAKSIHFVAKAMNMMGELTKNCRIKKAVHKYRKGIPCIRQRIDGPSKRSLAECFSIHLLLGVLFL